MLIFTDLNHIEDIYSNSKIMNTNDMIDLYVLDINPINTIEVLNKLGLILYRTKFHFLTTTTITDMMFYMSCIIEKLKDTDIYYFFDAKILNYISSDKNTDINIIEANTVIIDESGTNKKRGRNSKYPFKENAKKDLLNGMAASAVAKKYDCNISTIHSWKKEIEKNNPNAELIQHKPGYQTIPPEKLMEERKKRIDGLMQTSQPIVIDHNKTYTEDDGSEYYIDYRWYTMIKDIFHESGIDVNNQIIWIVEAVFEKYLGMEINDLMFEAILRVSGFTYSFGIVDKLYKLYKELISEYSANKEINQLCELL